MLVLRLDQVTNISGSWSKQPKRGGLLGRSI